MKMLSTFAPNDPLSTSMFATYHFLSDMLLYAEVFIAKLRVWLNVPLTKVKFSP